MTRFHVLLVVIASWIGGGIAHAGDPAGFEGANGAEEISSYWQLNGSIMALIRDGGRPDFQKIVYIQPRRELVKRGVEEGTIYFLGTKQADSFVGEARLFSRNCSPLSYEVSARLHDNADRIIVSGIANVRKPNCNLTGVQKPVVDVLERIQLAPRKD